MNPVTYTPSSQSALMPEGMQELSPSMFSMTLSQTTPAMSEETLTTWHTEMSDWRLL